MTEALAEMAPPILQGPSDKEKKYDRQLRLWAKSGQEALENAHILLLNSGSGTVGVESLKNLVLPGIGKFTIADDALVKDADLGVNFFLDELCLGKPRSKCCADLLQELNPDVQGAVCGFSQFECCKGSKLTKVMEQSIAMKELFQNDAKYTFIICTHPIDSKVLTDVEQYIQTHQIPMLFIHSAGFYSYFRIHLPGSFPIVDTHPDSTATTDLRLLTPWPELSNFAHEMTANIDELDTHEHGHVPYVILLLHYLEEWKNDHAGKPPQTYAEKTSFRKTVADGARTNTPEGGEENYDEAVAAVLKTITTPSLNSSVRDVFEYDPDKTEADSNFWIMTDAIKKFYAQHNALPLPGSVPDMKAQSEVYVRLQNIYKAKARQDAVEVEKLVRLHPRGAKVPVVEIEDYCKNAAFIKLIRSTGSSPSKLKALTDAELNAEFEISPTLIPAYLALRASETTTSTDEEGIISEILKLVGDAATDERVVQAAQEVARAKGGELHNISALTGGMVSQEVIKVITKQYIPIDNTCVFDGIRSRTQVFRI